MNIVRKIKNDLIKVLSLTFLANLIKIGINLITTKVIAVLIGPNGIAVIGQFTNFISTVTTTSTGGVSNGVVRYVSEHKNDKKLYNDYLNAAFSITILFSTVSMLILLLFAKQICMFLFNDLTYVSIIYITAFTLFLFSINNFLLSIINGQKLFDKFILINLVSSFTGLIFTIVLVFFLKTYGTLLALATYQSVVIIITIYVIKKNKLLRLNEIKLSFDTERWKNLFAYSLMATVGLIWPLINIAIRTTIIEHISIESAGIWEGMTKVSTLITSIVGAAITTYFLPRFSEISERGELKKEVFSGLKIILTGSFFLAALIFIFKNQIILILFTEQFSSMANLFGVQLAGDLFWVSKMTLSVILIAKAMTNHYIILELLFGLTYLAVSIILVHSDLGIISVPIAHLIYNFLYFVVLIFVLKKLLTKDLTKGDYINLT